MAGGEGTRLRPLTSNQPKPMVPVVGKPCMEHIIELLKQYGFDEVIVTVAFMPQAIRSYFGDGEGLGVAIEYSVEESPLGTAGSVRLASDKLDDTFLVISGDALCDVDLTEIMRVHKEREAAVTIGLKSVDNPLEFGIVVTDEDGRIERFLEKPSWGQVFSDTINTGIYVLEPEVLRHIPDDRPYDFSKELFPLLLEMGRPLYGHVFDGYWQDIGNLDQFRQANFDALDERVRLNIPGIKLRGNIWLGEGVDVDDLASIEGPALLGNYCRIAPDASVGAYSVLSSSVTLLERAHTERSVVDASTHIGRSARVEGAVVGRNCDIRAHVHVQEGASLGDEVTLGAQSAVFPGVRIFPYKEVETGAQIHESLIWESRAPSRLFGEDGVSGLVNVDLTPETAVRLAAALGTALKRGARVVASRESPTGCRMIKRAMLSGLTSTGVSVADLRVLPAAVGRHLLKTQGYDAGFHVGVSITDPEVVQIRFCEQPGIQLTTQMQKEVEKHFTRHELRRAAFGAVGDISYPARVRESYAQDLLAALDIDSVRKRALPPGGGLRLLVGLVRAAARARPARRRDGQRARVRLRQPRERHLAAGIARPGEAARDRGRRRPRRRLRPSGRAAVPRRRAGPRGAAGADAAALPPAARVEREARQARVPDHRHEPGRGDREGQQARGHPHAGLARRAHARGGRGRRHLRRRGERRLRVSRVPARLRRSRKPLLPAAAARAGQ